VNGYKVFVPEAIRSLLLMPNRDLGRSALITTRDGANKIVEVINLGSRGISLLD
jgi:hypothetical protein